MIKKALAALPMVATMLLLAASAQAASSVTVPLSASVTSVLTLGVEIREFKDGVVTNWGASALNFGTLKSDAAQGPMRGDYYFDVYLHPDSSSRPYKLTQTAAALSNGTATLPAGACVMTPCKTSLRSSTIARRNASIVAPCSVSRLTSTFCQSVNHSGSCLPFSYVS